MGSNVQVVWEAVSGRYLMSNRANLPMEEGRYVIHSRGQVVEGPSTRDTH